MSTYKLLFSMTDSSLLTTINPPIRLQGDWTVSLGSATYWNAFPNVSAKIGNNQFKYSPDSGSTWKTITIPDGAYQLESTSSGSGQDDSINGYVQAQIRANEGLTGTTNPITLHGNTATLHTDLIIATSGYQVDMTLPIRNLFGFNSEIITSTKSSEAVANITLGLDSININCNLVKQNYTYNNGVNSQILFHTPLTGVIGAEVPITPLIRDWLPIATNTIDQVQLTWTDQSNNPLDFNGQQGTIELVLAPVAQPVKVV